MFRDGNLQHVHGHVGFPEVRESSMFTDMSVFQRSVKAAFMGVTNQSLDRTDTAGHTNGWTADCFKKCPGTLVILGSVVRSTHNLYERFWYDTQSAPDAIIWTLLLLLQASLKKVYHKPKRRDIGLICMYVFSDFLSLSYNKTLSNHKSAVRVIR